MLQEVDLGLFEPELLSSLIAPIISGAPLLSLPFLKSSPALTVEVMLLSSVAPPPQPQSWCLQFLFAWFKNKSKSRRIICDSFRGWLNLRRKVAMECGLRFLFLFGRRNCCEIKSKEGRRTVLKRDCWGQIPESFAISTWCGCGFWYGYYDFLILTNKCRIYQNEWIRVEINPEFIR